LKCLSLNSNNLDFDVEGCIIPFANVLKDHGGIESLSLRGKRRRMTFTTIIRSTGER